MHSRQWHEHTWFMDFHYFLSKSRLIYNYYERTLLYLFSKCKYVNGICEHDMDTYNGVYERWYRTKFERGYSVK